MRKILIAAIVVLSLILTGLLGFMWYQGTHFFVEGEAYPKTAKELDLRGEEISENHYLSVRSHLPECRILWDVPFQKGRHASDAAQLTISTLNEEDIRILKAYFPELKKIDASACGDYAMLLTLAQQLPKCQVSYQVDLGAVKAEPGAAELTLEPGSYDFEKLLENLAYLPNLKSIHFPKTELVTEQTEALTAAYPELTLTQTVEILGREYDANTTVLDLSAMASADVAQVSEKLGMLPALGEVQLGSHLTLEDVQSLNLGAPDVVFHYSFDFYGIPVSTTDHEVMLKYVTVEDSNFPQKLCALLDVMENCKRVVLDAKGPYDKLWQNISDEQLAQIRQEYRDKTKLVWRIYFGENGSTLTDAEVLRAVYGLTDDNSKDLIYCENVRFLDLGHNEFLDYMDFLSGMTDLEVAILSGAPLKDLSPIAACKNLKFLEIANCIYLPNIDAVKGLNQLEMLNISFTRFEDLSPIYDLDLTHLTTVSNAFVSRGEPTEALQAFLDTHPDCWTVYEGSQPYGEGWRTDAEGKYLPWYAQMVKAFHYPNAYNNIGWYLD